MVVSAQALAQARRVDVLKKAAMRIDDAGTVGMPWTGSSPRRATGWPVLLTIQLADGSKTFIDFRENVPLARDGPHVPDKDAK